MENKLIYIGFLLCTRTCGWIVEEQKFNDEVMWNLEEELQRETSDRSLKNSARTNNDQIVMSHI